MSAEVALPCEDTREYNQKRLSYPLGFIRREYGNFGSRFDYLWDGDPEINRLMEYWNRSDTNKNSWDFHKDIINQSVRLIPNLVEFIEINRIYDELTDANFKFLQNVIDYIATGRQALSPHNAKAILDDVSRDDRKITQTRHCMIPECIFRGRTRFGADHISQWVSHPEGIVNMLLTMDTLFGKRNTDFGYY